MRKCGIKAKCRKVRLLSTPHPLATLATSKPIQKCSLLSGTAFAAGCSFALMLAANPQIAMAACAVMAVPSNVVACATTTTTDTVNNNAATASSSARHQQFTAGGNVSTTVNAGATVDGAGLAITTTQGGANLTFANDGVGITQTTAATQGGSAALNLTSTSGNTVYTGTGTVTTNQAGAIGINATAGSGNVVFLGAGVIVGSGAGISANASSGTVFVFGTNSVTGGTIGINATALAGNVSVTGNNTVMGGTEGIHATSAGGAVDVINNNTVNSLGDGISASSLSGNVTVTGNALVNAGGIGITTASNGGPASTVTVSGNGPVTGVTRGISAQVNTGALNVSIDAALRATQVTGTDPTGIGLNTFANGGTTTIVNNSTIQAAPTNRAINSSSAGGLLSITNNTAATINGIVTTNNAGTTNVSNAGMWNFIGNATIGPNSNLGGANGTLSNTGTINTVNNVVNNNVNAQNLAFSGAGTLRLDIDLSRNDAGQRADQVNVAGGNASQLVQFNKLATPNIAFATPIVVISGANANTITATQTGLPTNGTGMVNYFFEKQGNNWVVRAAPNPNAINTSLTGTLSAIASIDASFYLPASALVASPQSKEPNKVSCGPWSRVSGGQTNVSATGASTFAGTTTTTASKSATTFAGYQLGFDCGWLNALASGWNLHLGVTGGEVGAKTNETLGPGSVNFSVPFGGIYGLATHGSFFADASYRVAHFGMNVTNAMANMNSTPFAGTSHNVNASAGYQFRFENNFFIEPQAGVSVTRSQFNDLSFASTPASGSVQQLVQFNELKSTLVRAGARAGTTFVYRNTVAVSPFVVASVWSELEKSAGGTYLNNVNDPANPATATLLSVTRAGTFYQASLGVSGRILKTGWQAFVRGDLRTGENLNGWAALGGARYTFGCTGAANC